MIEKLDMKSMDVTQENIKKIQALFSDYKLRYKWAEN